MPGHGVEGKQVTFSHCCESLGSQGWPLVKPEESQEDILSCCPIRMCYCRDTAAV